ncbi:MAG TPA: hypothetical protein PL033_04610 [Candidatus Brocadiia bacterium]|nr:hypothetical protein [Candidatus Brocadiia bacterium]
MKLKSFVSLAFVLVAALSASASAELKIENLAFRMAKYGPVCGKAEYCVGETVYLTCDMTGMQTDPEGRVDVEINMTVQTREGQVLVPSKRVVALQEKPLYSAGRLAVVLNVTPGAEWPKGEYVVKVEAGDRAANATAGAEFAFTLTPPRFGLLDARMALDAEGQALIPFHVQKGMHAYILMTLAAPTYGENNLLDISLDINVRDEAGNLVGSQNVLDVRQNLGQPILFIPVNVSLSFNVPGKLEYELVVLDRNSRKAESVKLPVVVHE